MPTTFVELELPLATTRTSCFSASSLTYSCSMDMIDLTISKICHFFGTAFVRRRNALIVLMICMLCIARKCLCRPSLVAYVEYSPLTAVLRDGLYTITGGMELEPVENNIKPKEVPEEYYTLCRCGASNDKPFDGMHLRINFKDEKN